jgi:hypothetical protein
VSAASRFKRRLPGREANPESRDSGFDASHRPGMTVFYYTPPG